MTRMADTPDLNPQAVAAAIRRERDHERATATWMQWAPSRCRTATLASVYEQHPTVRADIEAHVGDPHLGPVVIIGPVGTGKTWTAAAIMRHAIDTRRASVRFHTMGDALQRMRPNGDLNVEQLVAPDVLVLDDVGTERATDWAVEQMYQVFDRRWSDDRATIVTSNLTTDDMRDHLGPRAWSRLTGSDALVIRLTGPDLRRTTA